MFGCRVGRSLLLQLTESPISDAMQSRATNLVFFLILRFSFFDRACVVVDARGDRLHALVSEEYGAAPRYGKYLHRRYPDCRDGRPNAPAAGKSRKVVAEFE
jgi:hypothetical protein